VNGKEEDSKETSDWLNSVSSPKARWLFGRTLGFAKRPSATYDEFRLSDEALELDSFLIGESVILAEGNPIKDVNSKKILTKAKFPPVIDGVLSEACWQASIPLTDFSLHTGKGLAKERTVVRVCYNDDGLYFGIECFESKIDQLVAKIKEHDGKVVRDDCIEIFLDPDADQVDYYHFVLNPIGTQRESHVLKAGEVIEANVAWDCPWEVKTAKGDKLWVAEVFIPFAGLNLSSQCGSSWRWNICRERRAGGPCEISCLFCTYGGFHQPSRFGELGEFDVDFSQYAYHVEVSELTEISLKGKDIYQGKLNVSIENKTGREADLIMKTSLLSPTGKRYSQSKKVFLKAHELKKIVLIPTVKGQGKYQINLSLLDSKTKRNCCSYQRKISVSFIPVEIISLHPVNAQGFIYADEEAKQIKVKTRLAKCLLSPDYHLQVSLKKRDEIPPLFTKEIKSLFSPEIEVHFPLQGLPPGDYEVFSNLLDKEENILYSTRKKFSKLKESEHVVKVRGKIILVDGEPFFPFGWYWHSKNPEDLKEYAREGYNTVFTFMPINPPETAAGEMRKRYLDAAQANGLKITLYPYPGYKYCSYKYPLPSEMTLEQAKEIKENLLLWKDHPAILGWYIADEPECGNHIPVGWAKAVNELVKSCDPYHITYVVNNTVEGQRAYLECADIRFPDVYTWFKKGEYSDWNGKRIVRSLDAARQATKGKMPVFAILQGMNSLSGNIPNGRAPTFVELRGQTYTAIIHGATGIAYYHYLSAYTEKPEVMIGMKECIIPEIKYLMPILLSSGEGKVNINPAPPQSKVHALLKKYQGELYLFAANTVNSPTTVRFQIPDPSFKGSLNVISEDRKVKVRDKSFTDKFNGYDVHIYTTARDLPPFKNVKEITQRIQKARAALRKEGNLAFEGEGTIAQASSHSHWRYPLLVCDGVTNGKSFWQDNTRDKFPDWIELKFHSKETIGRIVVYNDNLRDYEIQYWDGKDWSSLVKVTGNTDKVITHKFSLLTTDKIRLWIIDAEGESLSAGGRYSKIYEIEVYEK